MSESAVSAATLEELKAKAAAGCECVAFRGRPRPSELLLEGPSTYLGESERAERGWEGRALARDLQTVLTFRLCGAETSGSKLRRKLECLC